MSATVVTTTEAGTQELKTTKDLITLENKTYGDWRDEFHEKGCVLIKNVISKERAAHYAKKQIEWLKKFELGFDENDENTWTEEHLPVSFKGG